MRKSPFGITFESGMHLALYPAAIMIALSTLYIFPLILDSPLHLPWLNIDLECSEVHI